jgi:hypothetical protein
MNNSTQTATAFLEDPLQEEKLRMRLELQDTCHHDFKYIKVGYIPELDKEIEIAQCKKCGFNWD